MKPFDPRLLRYARATAGFLALSVLLGVVVTVIVIAQAALIADVVSDVFLDGDNLVVVRAAIVTLGLVLAARAVTSWLQELVAQRTSAAVKSDLRLAQARHALDLGPGWLTGQRSAELATLTTRGIEALDDYFSRYLPQLVLAVIVPVTLVVVIALQDPLSALIVALTLPLIPVFMALIGIATQRRQARQWDSLQRLANHFLDVVEGLPTLRVFGRAKAQAATVREVSEANRKATLGVLRISFLSSLTLELLATLSVALVAVSIGLRLVDGALDLRTGLFVLVLAPEAYLPLRLVGTHFHASSEGMAAAEQVFTVLEERPPVPVAARVIAVPDLRQTTIRLDGVGVRHPGRPTPALAGVDLEMRPGTVTALTGASGAGKTTLLSTVLGFTVPTSGRVLLETTDGARSDLVDCDLHALWRQLGWVPQRPHLFVGTVADNVRLSVPEASDDAVLAALAAAGFDDADRELPQGIWTPVGDGGTGLSAGQARRVALARAVLRDPPLLVLDEPTAALDEATEERVVEALAGMLAGRTVLLATHRQRLLRLADVVVELQTPDPTETAAEAVPV